jgi:hypothetical protein
MLDIQLLVDGEDEPGPRIEHGHRALHQLFEQLRLGAERVQCPSDVVERFQLKEFAAKLEVR